MKLDLSPLFHTSVGFDHLNRFLKEFSSKSQNSGYPPYDIIKISDDYYRISIALAGFLIKNIEIILNESELLISGKKNNDNEKNQFLYKGIANRSFEKKFQLADNIKITGAIFKNGLLNIDLEKITPIAKKPRVIKILE